LDFQYGHRADIESNYSLIQPIPVAVLASQDKGKVLVGRKVRRATSAKSAEKGKSLFYFGGHIRAEDRVRGDSNLQILIRCLQRELKEELGLDYVPDFSDALCIIDRTRGKVPQHMAVATLCTVDFDLIALRGDRREFAERGVEVVSQSQLREQRLPTERWSQVILQRILGWTFI
jgi:predicted NUDIX family phosphoesterase